MLHFGLVRSAYATTTAARVEHLDFATVAKLSQAVSGEMVLDRLIETLMRLAIEHAGAERGQQFAAAARAPVCRCDRNQFRVLCLTTGVQSRRDSL